VESSSATASGLQSSRAGTTCLPLCHISLGCVFPPIQQESDAPFPRQEPGLGSAVKSKAGAVLSGEREHSVQSSSHNRVGGRNDNT
jgi:hypothetical protein